MSPDGRTHTHTHTHTHVRSPFHGPLTNFVRRGQLTWFMGFLFSGTHCTVNMSSSTSSKRKKQEKNTLKYMATKQENNYIQCGNCGLYQNFANMRIKGCIVGALWYSGSCSRLAIRRSGVRIPLGAYALRQGVLFTIVSLDPGVVNGYPAGIYSFKRLHEG